MLLSFFLVCWQPWGVVFIFYSCSENYCQSWMESWMESWPDLDLLRNRYGSKNPIGGPAHMYVKHLNRQTDRRIPKAHVFLPSSLHTKDIHSVRIEIERWFQPANRFLTVVLILTLARSENQGSVTVGQPCGPEPALHTCIYNMLWPGKSLSGSSSTLDSCCAVLTGSSIARYATRMYIYMYILNLCESRNHFPPRSDGNATRSLFSWMNPIEGKREKKNTTPFPILDRADHQRVHTSHCCYSLQNHGQEAHISHPRGTIRVFNRQTNQLNPLWRGYRVPVSHGSQNHRSSLFHSVTHHPVAYSSEHPKQAPPENNLSRSRIP